MILSYRNTQIFLVAVFFSLAAAGNPEVGMTTPQIVQHWGYPVQIISVTTRDGYVLELHRIPYGKTGPRDGCRPVVFLQHGLECDSSNWVINLPSQSAAFLFADAGYDVWMGNMRGNTYSKAHTTLDPAKEPFWEFSWDEMARNDLEAMIDKALNVSGQPDLYYVGHSQGTLTMFSLLSADIGYDKKIKTFFALAPVGTVQHMKGLIKYAADFFLPEFWLWVRMFGSGEFLPSNWVMKLLASTLCHLPIGDALCDNFMFLITGPEGHQFNKSRTDVYVAHTPAGTSTQNIMHWAQMVKAGTVARYDYGSAKKNQEHYGTSKPPSYDFTTIRTPMHLFWSQDDWLATGQDIHDYLLTSLHPDYLKRVTELKGYNHLDFIFGLNAARDIYFPMMVRILEEEGGKLKCVDVPEAKHPLPAGLLVPAVKA